LPTAAALHLCTSLLEYKLQVSLDTDDSTVSDLQLSLAFNSPGLVPSLWKGGNHVMKQYCCTLFWGQQWYG